MTTVELINAMKTNSNNVALANTLSCEELDRLHHYGWNFTIEDSKVTSVHNSFE